MTFTINQHPSSYRDPSGFIFEKEGILYRQVNISFKDHFDHFIQSGCYNHLVEKGLLIPHEEINKNISGNNHWYTTLQPERLAFISYPYEWCFDILKDAALLTLRMVKEGLHFGMILKDASPYNVQWRYGKLIFIDSLSFEKYEENPWIAYRQFCENFLGPLLLMHYSRRPLQQVQLSWPEGIPLDIIQSLLPKRSRFSIDTYLHIHLHNRISAKRPGQTNQGEKFSKQKLLRLIASLETLVNSLRLPPRQSTWSAYYDEASSRNNYLQQKRKIISEWVEELPSIQRAADLGANEGEFSRLLADKNISIIATDFDPYCINSLYNNIKNKNEKQILPLIIDLANPSPAIGVNNQERSSFIDRTHVDLALALALIHHLAIGKNIPFDLIAFLFKSITDKLIIEFVPISDEKVQYMLAQKPGLYPSYNELSFQSAFEQYFKIEKKQDIAESGRTLFLMTNKLKVN